MAKLAYYATKLSENRFRTPEGFLLCKNCVLARTGFQQYLVSDVIKDLEDEDIKELGLEGANPNSSIDLYRPKEEVFASATIASGEGKPLTDEHPSEFVNPNNFLEHVRGHVQNVRKGIEPLDSGDLPLVGDILVEEADVIDKVENRGIRELSCGYSHELEKRGDKICQVKIVINHVALVRKGRAGPEARINDSADDSLPGEISKLVDEVKKLNSGNDKSKENKKISTKDVAKRSSVDTLRFKSRETKMAKKESNILHRLFGMGIKAMAMDEETSPEELAEATKEMHDKMADALETPEEITQGEKSDKKDVKKEDGACPHCGGKKDEESPMMEKEKPMVEETDDREKHHAMLDRILDEMGIGKEKESGDSDVAQLKNLLDQYLGEEEKEPEHQDAEEEVAEGPDGSEAEVIEPIEDGEEEEEEEGMIKNDAAAALLPVISKCSKSIQKSFDSVLETTLDDEGEFVKKFRPFVRKEKDSKLISAFNAEVRRIKGTSTASDASYAGFSAAAKKRPERKDSKYNDPYADLEAAYKKALTGEGK